MERYSVEVWLAMSLRFTTAFLRPSLSRPVKASIRPSNSAAILCSQLTEV